MSDSDTPTARRYRSADADMIDNELLVTPGSNGDWYLTIVPTGQRFGPTVRITTSGAKRGMEHVPRGVRALYDSLGGVSQHDARPSTCVAVLVTNAANPEEVCLIKHGARGTWEMPGGKMYFGETIAQAAKREGMEEAGLDITVSQDPVRAENGQRGVVVLLCRGTAEGTPTAGSDAVDARWFHRDEIPWEELSSIISAETLRTWAFGPDVPLPVTNLNLPPFDLPPLGVVEDRTHAQRVADGDACDDTTTDGEVEDCR